MDFPVLNQIVGNAMRSKYTLVLDENISQLKMALKDAGFKVIEVPKGMLDSEVFELAETFTILTQNRIDFKDHAKANDFDLIDLKNIKFIDDKKDRTNSTVQKIIKALRESNLANLKGNFHLTILDDGSFKIQEVVI